MGLNWHGVKFLAQARRSGVDFSRTITIGRLGLYTSIIQVQQVLTSYGLPHGDVPVSPKYAELIFKILGAHTVDSIDTSNYEDATIIADLNRPIPPELFETYDLVYDGGTIEHVFNVEQSLKNIMSLPKIGGRVIIHTMANNFFGHGFYQFSPELFYRVFSKENGYVIERVIVHADFDFAQWYEIPDPAEVHDRIELANNTDGLLLFVSARRDTIVPLFEKPPQQSDYSALWQGSLLGVNNSSSCATAKTPASQSNRRNTLRASITAQFPWAGRLKRHIWWAMPTVPRLLNVIAGRRYRRQKLSIERQKTKFRPVE